MTRPGNDPDRHSENPDVEVLVQRASMLNLRSRQTLMEMNVIRARAELALKRAADAVLKAHDIRDLAAEHLVSARERRLARRRAKAG